MAQLKDLLVLGPSRLVGDAAIDSAQISKLTALTSSGSTSYGPGTNGQVLYTNANAVYWGSLPALPQASSLTPKMDGTAAVGTSATFARADHVHPTDTSRAASSHTHGNITNAGDITTTVAIASGDRLVINDESESKINNSTITFGTSTTQFLANNGTWQTYTAPSNPNWTATTGVTSILNKPTIPAAQVNSNWTATTGVASILNKPTIPSTYTDVGAASAAHTHGNITNAGDITATATIASGDRLIINDESASKVINSTITFGTATNSFLANNGTWLSAPPIIPYAQVDSTSTSTVFTATVSGVTSYYDGLSIFLKNGRVTSAAGFTINVNGLGAKPVYNNMAAATADTTIFNINYTMLFMYDSTRVSGGCWICYRGYDSNSDTVGYQLRTNNTILTVSDTARYYKIYFTSANGQQWVPASVNSTNNATTKRDVNQRPIDPFGRIVYTSASTNYTQGSDLAAATTWSQYNLTLGYSFNRTGAALTLTTKAPVYIKCAPQANGSAIMDATTPYVQALPSSNDGKIYIFLGIATSATAVELYQVHPVYYHDGNAICLWSGDKPIPTATIQSILNGTYS